MRTDITYSGVAMTCDYAYQQGYPQTFESPREPEYVDVLTCEVGGVDIADLLSISQLKEIEAKVLKAHHALMQGEPA